MKSKRPIWHLSRCPDDLRILPRNISRIGLAASQEVEVEYAADDVILKRSGTLAVPANLHVHSGRAEEEDGVGAAIGTMLKVHRVISVQVRPGRNPIRVTGPQRARRVGRVEAEGIGVFAEAVDVRHGRERGLEAQVLRLENERVVRGREEHLARAAAGDVEGEGRGGVRKFDLRCVWEHCRVRRGSREDRLGDFVARVGRVGNLEMDARFCAMGGREPVRSCMLLYGPMCQAADVPVSYTTARSRTLMSLPNTLQGVPARTSLADSLGPSTSMLVAVYPGQPSKSAGSTSTARATSTTGLARKTRNAMTTPRRRGMGGIIG